MDECAATALILEWECTHSKLVSRSLVPSKQVDWLCGSDAMLAAPELLQGSS